MCVCLVPDPRANQPEAKPNPLLAGKAALGSCSFWLEQEPLSLSHPCDNAPATQEEATVGNASHFPYLGCFMCFK